MNEFSLAAATALWLGILTSISPCPLATNIAAVSFIAARLGSTRAVLGSGLLYTLGRVVTYVVLGALLVAGLLAVPGMSNFLQKYINKLIGPILIITGMVLLELIKLNIPGLIGAEKIQSKVERSGIWGAGLLGVVFALSFCPVSAALFFGSLIALSIKHGSRIALPALYGIGTGLPVVACAVLLALGGQHVAKAFDRLKRVEWWARRITGGVFILVGIYLSLRYIFGLL